MYFVGAPNISAGGRRMVNMVNVTPLIHAHINDLKIFPAKNIIMVSGRDGTCIFWSLLSLKNNR